ncbi:MAG TPA: cellulose synthase operon protein YhjQ/BcsQ [Bryobacteraceae bacterium]|nr:cellulose synthase operon protein YhjQ/BcsQ [Bryobacteraceae bacterium]
MTTNHAARPLTIATRIYDPALAAEIQACLPELPVQVVAEPAESCDWELWLEQVEAAKPDVVLLGLDVFPGSLEAAIARMASWAQTPAIVVAGAATDPQTVLGAIRAGAAEYVYPPATVHLTEALRRLSETRAQQDGPTRRGKIAAFVSAKGGCGATTVACHVAAGLHQHTGQATLLADFDLDNGVVGFLTKTRSGYTVQDAIRNCARLDASYWKALVSEYTPGLDVICSPGDASDAPDDAEAPQAVVEFARSQYDWVVLDLGRGLAQATRKILESIDELFLVTTLDVPALYRCQHMLRALEERGFGRERVKIVVNRISRSAEVTRDEMAQILGVPVSFELPDAGGALAEAYVDGKLLAPSADLSKRLGRMARRIAGIPDAEPRRFSFSWLAKPSENRFKQAALAVRS